MRPPKLFTLHYCLTLVSCLCAATQIAYSAENIPLQAGIEHAEKLPAVKLSAMAGQKFDEKTSIKVEDKEWYLIPNWFAGTWRTIQRVRTSRYDNHSGEVQTQELISPEREREVFGYQTDRQQNIWTTQKPLQPIVTNSTMPNTESPKPPDTIPLTVYTFRQNHLISEDASKVILKTIDTILTVRNDNYQIESTELRETYRIFSKLDSELIAMQSDEQTYDQQGLPKVRSKFVEFRKKDADMKVVDEYKMTNILVSFKAFLKGSGQSTLAPER